MLRMLRRSAVLAMVVGGVLAVREWRRARAAGEAPFPALRRFGNERLDAWVLRFGLAGGRHSEIATMEHVGRSSGTLRYTPVHATFSGDDVWIPLPFGEASQWARNVVAAGHCRMQLHETLHELDRPEIVAPSEDPLLARPVQWALGELSMRYLRLHRAVSVPGTFAMHGGATTTVAGDAAGAADEPPLDAVFELARHEAPASATIETPVGTTA